MVLGTRRQMLALAIRRWHRRSAVEIATSSARSQPPLVTCLSATQHGGTKSPDGSISSVSESRDLAVTPALVVPVRLAASLMLL
jgi:hypothetical protein